MTMGSSVLLHAMLQGGGPQQLVSVQVDATRVSGVGAAAAALAPLRPLLHLLGARLAAAAPSSLAQPPHPHPNSRPHPRPRPHPHPHPHPGCCSRSSAPSAPPSSTRQAPAPPRSWSTSARSCSLPSSPICPPPHSAAPLPSPAPSHRSPPTTRSGATSSAAAPGLLVRRPDLLLSGARSGRDRAEIGPRCVAEISPRDQTYPRDSPWYSRRPTDEVAAPAQSASPLPPQRPTRRRFQGRSSTPSAAALRVRSRRAESCLAPPRPVSPSSSALPSAGARPARPRGRLSSRRLAARPGGLPRLDPRGGARVDGEAQAEANVSGVERGATLIARDKPRAHAERPEGGRDQRSTCIRAGGADWMAGASRRGTAVA